MTHLLITGGAGFIGSNLISILLKDKNIRISCLDNMDESYSSKQKYHNISCFSNNPNFNFFRGDICNMSDLNKIEGVDVIVHLAAKAGVRESIKDPLSYQKVNVHGTHVLLEYAKTNGIKQFLFASSSSVYGINNNVPWKENEELLPISPYASTKLSSEMLGHVYSHLFGINFISLRFFTVYGPAQRPDLAIHKFFKCIINNEPVTIYGDGSTLRDYTFIDDLVKGIVAAIKHKGSKFEIINLGNQQTISILNLVTQIEKICGNIAIIKHIPDQEGDVPQTYADITKANKLLNYTPKQSLSTGLESFFKWFKEDCIA